MSRVSHGTHGPLSQAQRRLLELLGRAYDEDVPVHVGGASIWRGAEKTTAARTVLANLQMRGLALFTPEGRFALITPAGRGFLASLK